MYAESDKNFDFEGMVISSIRDSDSEQTNLVLLLQFGKDSVNQKPRIYGVSTRAFVAPSADGDFGNVEVVKNLERRFSMPLKFGDVIRWNSDDCDEDKRLIVRFRREKPLGEISSDEHGHLIKIGGVIDAKAPNSFWTRFRTIPIPLLEVVRAEPDVWLNAWIRMETRMTDSSDNFHLDMTFVKFDEFKMNEQSQVAEAPWHRGTNSKFEVWRAEPTPCESDDEIDLEPPEDLVRPESKWAEVINRQIGLYVGNRLIVCKELPQYDFVIALLNPVERSRNSLIYPVAGEYFHFSAVWSSAHRNFLVTDLIPYKILMSHQVTVCGNICVRVTFSKYKGLFIDHGETLGLMDDPSNCLSFFEFYPDAYEHQRASVEVRAIRASENKTVRYRIVKIVSEDEHMQRFSRWLRFSKFFVGAIEGVVINSEYVISAKYPNVVFRLPTASRDKRPAFGSYVVFDAEKKLEFESELHITDWRLSSKRSPVRNVIERDGIRLLQVALKPVPNREQLAISEAVGLVDIRHGMANGNGDEYYGWIRESPLVGQMRSAVTVFELFSVYAVPVITPNVTQTSPQSRSGSVASNASSCASKMSRASSSISSNRYVGPGHRARSNASTPSSAASSTK